MPLPPIGEPARSGDEDLVSYLQGLAEEATFARNRWDPIVTNNVNVFTYGDVEPPDDDEIILPEIQNAVIVGVNVMTKEAPTVTLEPVETGEPPTYYAAIPPHRVGEWLPTGATVSVDPMTLQPVVSPTLPPECLGIDPLTGQPFDAAGNEIEPAPLNEDQADLLMSRAVTRAVAPVLPPNFIRPNWLVSLDDDLVSDVYQSMFDVLWARGEFDLRIRENLLDTCVQGWAGMLFEFDDEGKRPILRHVPIKQLYIDPTVRGVHDAAYAGYDYVLDAAEAKALYPALAEKIDYCAATGQPDHPDGTGSLSAASNRDFRRKMVVLRTFWLRNQPITLTEQEAVERGLVDEREVEALPPEDIDDVLGGLDFTGLSAPDVTYSGGDDQDTDAAVPDAGDAGPSAGDPGSGDEDLQPDSDPALSAGVESGLAQGGEVPDAIVPAIPMRVAYFLAGTDEEVAPGDANWPIRLVIREIRTIATEVVSDRECEHADIPLLLNVNIPLPTSEPFGLGEPYRLYPLQKAQSRFLRNMVDHTDYYGAPVEVLSESMYETLGEDAKEFGLRAGQRLRVPDAQYLAAGGKIVATLEPPAMPPALPTTYGLLKQEMNDSSGNRETLEGRANPQIKSGRQYEMMLGQAASLVGFRSQRTGDMIKQAALLLRYCMATRLTPEDFHKVYSKIPLHVMKAAHAKGRDAEWDTKVQVGTSGGAQQAKESMAIQLFGSQLISKQTAQERASIDSRIEDQRQESEFAKQAKLQAMLAPPAPPAGPGAAEGEQEGEAA